MSMSKGLCLAVTVVAVLCGVGVASAQKGLTCTVTEHGNKLCTPQRTAYSLTEVTIHMQTLSDGTQIRSRTETRRAEDADGRSRNETLVDPNNGNQNQQVMISDPVAHTNITLYPGRKIAQISRTDAPSNQQPLVSKEREDMMRAFYKALQPSPEEAARANEYPQPKCSNEAERPDTFAGMPVTVSRETCIFPAGLQGSDREMRSVTEFWVLEGLGITVRSVQDDPRMGRDEMSVEDFKLGPPDPELFRVPDDYKVFDLSKP